MDSNNQTFIASKPKSSSKAMRIILITLGVVLGIAMVGLIGYTIFVLVTAGDLSYFGEPFEVIDGEIIYERDSCPDGNCNKLYLGNGRTVNGQIMTGKPIIYLYPESKTEVSVKLGYPEVLTVSYPMYKDGWRVLAEPSGDLLDRETNRKLYSLYWEARNDLTSYKIDSGFIVKGGDIAEFLEEKLAILGLNEREAEEFIVYWLPKMEKNAYNFVYFARPEEIEREMPLEVAPNSDTEIRVRMLFEGFDDFRDLQAEYGEAARVEEVLVPAPSREGFTLVEWGAVDLN